MDVRPFFMQLRDKGRMLKYLADLEGLGKMFRMVLDFTQDKERKVRVPGNHINIQGHDMFYLVLQAGGGVIKDWSDQPKQLMYFFQHEMFKKLLFAAKVIVE